MKLILTLLFVGSLVPEICSAQEIAQQKYTYKVFRKEDSKWGYDILRNRKAFIHQPEIPAVQGRKSFQTKRDARKTAKLSLRKIKSGIVPPTITIDDLQQLKIINKD